MFIFIIFERRTINLIVGYKYPL